MATSNFDSAALSASASIMNGAMSYAGGRAARKSAEKAFQQQLEYNKWAVAQNQAENQKARDWQEKMWNAENAYNSASNQVARLRAAGLNPNLAYGSLSSGNALAAGSSPSSISAPALDTSSLVQGASMESHGISSLGESLKDAMLFKAQIANIEADTSKKNAEAGVSKQEERVKSVEADVAEATEFSQITIVRQRCANIHQEYNLLVNQVAESKSRKDNVDSDTALKQAQEELIPFQEYMYACMAMQNLASVAKTDAETKKVYKEIEEIGSRIGLNLSLSGYYKESARLTSYTADSQEAMNKVFASDEFVNALSEYRDKMMKAENAFNEVVARNPRWKFAGSLLGASGSAAGGLGSLIMMLAKSAPK